MRSVAVLFVAAALAATLTACGANAEPAETTPTASATAAAPVFASEEEALAAAEDAYREYLRIYDSVLHNGGQNPEVLTDVTTGEALKEALDGAKEFRDKGLRSVGSRSITRIALQAVDGSSVRFYVCENVDDVDLIDARGASLVAPDRPSETPFEVLLSLSGSGVRISERVLWSGEDICVS
jgi:hypothetical protein